MKDPATEMRDKLRRIVLDFLHEHRKSTKGDQNENEYINLESFVERSHGLMKFGQLMELRARQKEKLSLTFVLGCAVAMKKPARELLEDIGFFEIESKSLDNR